MSIGSTDESALKWYRRGLRLYSNRQTFEWSVFRFKFCDGVFSECDQLCIRSGSKWLETAVARCPALSPVPTFADRWQHTTANGNNSIVALRFPVSARYLLDFFPLIIIYSLVNFCTNLSCYCSSHEQFPWKKSVELDLWSSVVKLKWRSGGNQLFLQALCNEWITTSTSK